MTKLEPFTSGYMKPPKEHQFKKGQSGNPRGRPKKKETFGSITIKVLSKKVRIKGREEKVTMTCALGLRLHELATKGYGPAIKILQRYEVHASYNLENTVLEDQILRRNLAALGYTMINGVIHTSSDDEADESQDDE